MTRDELIDFADFWNQLPATTEEITSEDIDRYLAEREEKKQERSCINCRNYETLSTDEPCYTCEHTTNPRFSNWQPK